jgi:hypothetical protein
MSTKPASLPLEPAPASADEKDIAAARALLNTYISQYLSYHGRREALAITFATTLLVGAAAVVFRSDRDLPSPHTWWFATECVALASTAGALLWMLEKAFMMRRDAAAFVEASCNVYAEWLFRTPTVKDLAATPRYRNGRHTVPFALNEAYRDLFDSSERRGIELVVYVLVAVWLAGAAARLVAFYWHAP